jgi:uncharacterized protein
MATAGLVISSFAFLTSARAAGFDCAKARSETETTICSKPELSTADEGMATAYKAAVAIMPMEERQAIVAEQKRWLGARARDCGANLDCLKEQTTRRLDHLKAVTALALEATNDQTPLAELPDEWEPGLMVICSPRLGLFDIRLPLNPDTSLAGLADDERKQLAAYGVEVGEENCKLRDDLMVTVKYRGSHYHPGMCGGVWRPEASIWINGRPVSRRATFYAARCYRSQEQSITLHRDVVRSCATVDGADQFDLRRDCGSQPLAAILSSPPDPNFAHLTPTNEKLLLLEGKGDVLCERMFERWHRDGEDSMEDLFEEVKWAPEQVQYKLDGRIQSDSFHVTDVDLNGDGKPEVISRFSWDSRMNSGDRFIITHDHEPISSLKKEVSAAHPLRALRESKSPHLGVFDKSPFPADHFEIKILKKTERGTRPLLIQYPVQFETMYRSFGTEIVATRIVAEVDGNLAIKSRCKVGPNLQKGERLE